MFLERVFHKLMLDFAWWVNRKDVTGRNVFQGGFLGLDNVGVFNRSEPLPPGMTLNQADGTAWVAAYALSLMRIALELAIGDPIFQELAAKFFDHFLYIAHAMTDLGGTGIGMWDYADEFYYDELVDPSGKMEPLRVRSLVGLVPLLAVEVLGPETLIRAPIFRARLERALVTRKDLAALVSRWHEPGQGDRRLLSLLRGHRMKRLLRRMLDPNEFLSDHGIRSLSKAHRDQPFTLDAFGQRAFGALRARRVRLRNVRRQLELAGPGLGAGQLPVRHRTPQVLPVLRGRLPRRVSDRLGRQDVAGRRCRRDRPAGGPPVSTGGRRRSTRPGRPVRGAPPVP